MHQAGVQNNKVHLPLELIELIIDHGDEKDHYAWSVACQATLHRARSHLLFALRIRGERRYKELFSFPDGGKGIMQHVRKLKLSNVHPELDLSDHRGLWALTRLSVLLSAMPQLVILTFTGFHVRDWYEIPHDALKSLGRHPNIREVMFRNCHYLPISHYHTIIASISRLSQLTIENCSSCTLETPIVNPVHVKHLILAVTVDPEPIYDWLLGALEQNCVEELGFELLCGVPDVDIPALVRLTGRHSSSLRVLHIRVRSVGELPGMSASLRIYCILKNDLRVPELSPILRRLILVQALHLTFSTTPSWLSTLITFADELPLSIAQLHISAELTGWEALQAALSAGSVLRPLLDRRSPVIALQFPVESWRMADYTLRMLILNSVSPPIRHISATLLTDLYGEKALYSCMPFPS
jgi:hypothetical protein